MRSLISFALVLASASLTFAQENNDGHVNQDEAGVVGVPVVLKECTSEHKGDYDLPLHIGAVFIVIGISVLGLALPYLANRFLGKSLQKDGTGFRSLKLFGAGVIIATALVHMMIPAFAAFTDPCLPSVLNEDYSAWAAIFAIFGIFLTHLIQIFIRQEIARRRHREKIPSTELKAELSLETDKKERKSTVFVLEAGIAIHSVIIGIILGFAKDEFVPLLVALGFHQFFEGIALSTIIIEINFSSLRPMILAFVGYALSTPSGVAIGIICHQFVANYSIQTEVIATGALEAFGAGILLYDVLVNIIAPHFSEPSTPAMRTKSIENGAETEQLDERGENIHVASFVYDSVAGKIMQLTALYLGATIMAVIGRWA